MIIDTHQHFWKLDRGDYDWLTPDLAPLYRDFLPEDLAPLLQEAGVDGTIVVQAAATVAETEYMLSLADRHDWILGVVGWVDFESPEAPATIARLAEHPKLVGLRPMIQDIPDDDWMLREALRPAIAVMIAKNLTFDALVMPRHLGHLKAFLSRYPDLRVVVDHCAKPEVRNGAFAPWAAGISQIAAVETTFCKLSGLVTEASDGWTAADLAPYIEHVLEVFGPDRVLFGSDWPVLNLQSDYGQWHALVCDVLSTRSEKEQAAIMSATAQRAYPRLSGKAT